jgi:hypothetical protein
VASYDKIVKYLVEKLQAALSPLEQISRTQNIMVAQNKQIIELLSQLNGGRQPAPESEQEEMQSEAAEDSIPEE